MGCVNKSEAMLKEAVKMTSELKFEPVDCSLFCIGRNFSRVNFHSGQNSTCFCSNDVPVYNSSECERETTTDMNIFKSYKLDPFKLPPVKNNSFLGCITSLKNFTFDGKQSTMALGNIGGMKYENCIDACHSMMQSLAVFIYNQTLQRSPSCVCLKSLWRNLNKLLDAENPDKCPNKVFATPWGLSQCTYTSFQQPNQTKIPQVGLVTVPGSGNTWTRSILQSMTGVLSGTVYPGEIIFQHKLFGGREPWETGRANFIKNHGFDGKVDQMNTFWTISLLVLLCCVMEPVSMEETELGAGSMEWPIGDISNGCIIMGICNNNEKKRLK
ncbi:sialate:O-sulfotransferase 1-like [Convolutriloba macropyga]|uniref:sialate:O-sulfotransferase 1-like n=1 Tax=Convolutriloba macropyga TaxID=536237 RepID=UPI003F528D36